MRTRLFLLSAVILGITAVVLWFTVMRQSPGLKAGPIVGWGGELVGVESKGLFVQVAAGERHSLALRKDGAVVAWGDNSAGQCRVPKPNKDFVAVAAGAAHSMAIRNGRTSSSQ